MLDGVMLRMVEEATHAGYPMDAQAVLLVELEGIRVVHIVRPCELDQE